ncbi:MAG: calcium/sodium antiporter [Akkermansiaceae bacterium]
MLDFVCIILGLVLLYYGAEWFVAASSEFAVRIGISPLVVGLTVVAFGTSAPELAVSIDSNLKGSGGMAIGNVIGSNICNICLVLGLAAVVYPLAIQRQVIRREMPILLIATLAFVILLLDFEITQLEGAILAGGIITYVATSLFAARKEEDLENSEEVPEELIEAARKGGAGRASWNIVVILGGVLVLVVGAKAMVYGGVNVARDFGVSEAVIGLTLFALGTSLPELATSLVAAKKRQGDIIVGNVVGSCIFNILAVVGFTACVSPLVVQENITVDLVVMVAVSFIVLPMMWCQMNLNRMSGLILFLAYLTYIGWLGIQQLGE